MKIGKTSFWNLKASPFHISLPEMPHSRLEPTTDINRQIINIYYESNAKRMKEKKRLTKTLLQMRKAMRSPWKILLQSSGQASIPKVKAKEAQSEMSELFCCILNHIRLVTDGALTVPSKEME